MIDYATLSDLFELEQGERFQDSDGSDLISTLAFRLLKASGKQDLVSAGIFPTSWKTT